MHATVLSAAPSATRAAVFDLQRGVVWLLFLLSGFCGLVYEVLWCRHLGLLFGNTVQSMSAVLTAFMAGLALGSYIGGMYAERLRRPMMVYGILELAIGLYCAFLPWAFGASSPIIPFYRSLYGEAGGGTALSIARFAISFFLLLVPTTLMGATLPVLSQFMVRSSAVLGKTVGALYAVNTFGAVAGAALTGFVMLPLLGKALSNEVAVAANLILGTLAVIFGMRESAALNGGAGNSPGPEPDSSFDPAPLPPSDDGPDRVPVSPLALRLTVAAFGITGFAAMATQIGWTRAISLATGSSTYAFSLIVSIFIFGLSIGGVWGSRAAAKTADPLALLGKVLITIGLFSLVLTIVLGFGPKLFFFLIALSNDSGWSWQVLYQALGILFLIIGPTFLMGATLPLTMQVAARADSTAGRTVGTIYAVNTLGSILGSFVGGLVLLPWLEIRGTLQVMAVLYLLPGIALFFLSHTGKVRRFTGDTLLVLMAVVASGSVWATSRPWDPLSMSSGLYLLRDARTLKAVKEHRWLDAIPLNSSDKILYYREGSSSTVAITEIHDGPETLRTLTVGGKPDASSGRDMSTQLGLALIPELFHSTGAVNVLVVGLGSGVSAAAALAPESVKTVDVVEMSPEVVEASYYFKDTTGLKYRRRAASGETYWLDTPRLNLIVNDGRNHLLLTSRKYDVIASEPSNPWLAGVGNLFTREAFELTRAHLKENGVMCQWIHRYSLEEHDFFSIVRTFAEVYPQVQLWCVNRHDFLLVGSEKTVCVPLKTLSARIAERNVNALLKLVRFDSEEELAACFLSGDSELRGLSSRNNAPIHTDDNMLLEFSAPKALYKATQLLRGTQFEADPETVVDLAALTLDERSHMSERLDLACAAREHARCAFEEAKSGGQHWMAASLLAPRQLWVQEYKELITAEAMARVERNVAKPKLEVFTRAEALSDSGEVDQALETLDKYSAQLQGGETLLPVFAEAVKIMRADGRGKDALALLDGALKNFQHDPKAAPLWKAAAEILGEEKKEATAFVAAQRADELAEPDGQSTGVTAHLYLAEKRFAEAHAEFHHRCVLNPLMMELRTGLADALMGLAPENKAGAEPLRLLRLARRASREASFIRNDDPSMWLRLAESDRELSLADKTAADFHLYEARNAWQHVVELDKANVLRETPPAVPDAQRLESRRMHRIEETFRKNAKDVLELAGKLDTK